MASGAFIPSTNVWDVSQLQSMDVTSPEFKELLIRLHQNINNIAIAINLRDAGYYDQKEFINGQRYFPNPMIDATASPYINPAFRQVFRMVVNFGQLPDTNFKSVNHNIPGISNMFTFTRIYATASDTTGLNYIPIPYASPVLVNNIELSVNATQVTITTGSNRTNFNECYVVLEYIKT